MESSFCAKGHEVWWAELNGRTLPFVRFTRGYSLEPSGEPGQSTLAVAHPLRECYRLHADICRAAVLPILIMSQGAERQG